jgi:D-sedoheptulose 7-phosphate isomerase
VTISIPDRIRDTLQVIEATRAALTPAIEAVTAECVRSLQAGGTIFWAGNGGSAADAQHMAAELVGRFLVERSPLRSIALTVDTSALTAIGNDYGFERTFARQLQALGRRGDVLMAISTSGNSANILAAAQTARAMGITVVGLTGRTGGKLKPQVDRLLAIPSESTPRIQEALLIVEHLICEGIEASMASASASGSS